MESVRNRYSMSISTLKPRLKWRDLCQVRAENVQKRLRIDLPPEPSHRLSIDCPPTHGLFSDHPACAWNALMVSDGKSWFMEVGRYCSLLLTGWVGLTPGVACCCRRRRFGRVSRMAPRRRRGGGKAIGKKSRRKRSATKEDDGMGMGEAGTEMARQLLLSEEEEDNGEEDEENGQSYFEAMAVGERRSSTGAVALLTEGEVVFQPEKELGPEAVGMEGLRENYRSVLFPVWEKILRCGIGLLVIGLGSKRKLLLDFAESITGPAVVVINGYNPNASLKLLFRELSLLVPDVERGRLPGFGVSSSTSTAGSNTMAEEMAIALEESLSVDVLIVVHSIDGAGLRGLDTQRALATLASKCTRIRFLASMDHANAPLLWDGKLWHQFEWCIQSASTYESYVAERAYSVGTTTEALLNASSVQGGTGIEDRQVRGAVMLLKSLSSNARGIFRILIDSGVEGISERQLLSLGREKFVVTNPSALRNTLTEMQTHELITVGRKSLGGGDKITLLLTQTQIKLVLDALDI